MYHTCACGDECEPCEDCGNPYCECECYVKDEEDEEDTDEW